MNIPLFSNPPAALLLVAASLGNSQVSAQTSADTPAPPAYRSALEGYQSYTDEKVVNWKEANDNAGRIGGWREYAKEAGEAQTPEVAARPVPDAAPTQPRREKP